jgi:Histidine kinase-, DNA gyrase B-, and HSP90-like ATPase
MAIPEPVDPNLVHAEATKEFFISMLVRDIDLLAAVIDLVDNSVDGGRSLGGEDGLSGRWVHLTLASTHFRVEDNCGGIDLNTARNYAFRFGREPGYPHTPHSIGEFGVGMKRALFKLGSKFSIDSRARHDSFLLKVDVEEWRTNPRWEFSLDSFHENEDRPQDQTSTTIEVTDLHPDVAQNLERSDWIADLADELSRRHALSIRDGLELTVNGTHLDGLPMELLQGDRLFPARKEISYTVDGSPVKLVAYAGVAKSELQYAGWYVFCNRRLILGPDRSRATVWGATGLVAKVVIFHPQYSRFRGYAFFDSDDPSKLPWTTTKTAIDTDSQVWRDARNELARLTRPIILWLNKLDRQNDARRRAVEQGDEVADADADLGGMLEEAIETAATATVDDVETRPNFTAPEPDPDALPPELQSIQYLKPEDEVARAKQLLGVETNRQVGEQTFDYYLDAEDR